MTRMLVYTTDNIQQKAIMQVWIDIKRFLRGEEMEGGSTIEDLGTASIKGLEEVIHKGKIRGYPSSS
jgi:hypothetical protein